MDEDKDMEDDSEDDDSDSDDSDDGGKKPKKRETYSRRQSMLYLSSCQSWDVALLCVQYGWTACDGFIILEGEENLQVPC